ncbi:MAG: hypothetical protein AABW48_03145 [Nanoarchaeota archaeon]
MTELEYKIWAVTIRYDVYHDWGIENGMKNSYKVVGKNENEALQKARALFSDQEWTKELMEKGTYEDGEVFINNYRESTKVYRARVSMPKISGPDAERFKVVPKLLGDNQSIEYIVEEEEIDNE